jgi:hypothetical protein
MLIAVVELSLSIWLIRATPARVAGSQVRVSWNGRRLDGDVSHWPTGESSHRLASMPAFGGTPDENLRANRTVGKVENDPKPTGGVGK